MTKIHIYVKYINSYGTHFSPYDLAPFPSNPQNFPKIKYFNKDSVFLTAVSLL